MARSGGLEIETYITRKEALSQGLKFFFIGKVCNHGHLSKRFVSNYGCYECSKQRFYSQLQSEKYKLNRPLQSKREYHNNKERYYANNATRRAVAKKATPKWLSVEQKNKIKEMYKNRKKGYDVDHIVPLNSCIVCGLNVPWNLQYLPSDVNASKSNKL